MEISFFGLETVEYGAVARLRPRECHLHWKVEEIRPVRIAPDPPLVKLVDALLAEPPARALIGARGVRVPVAEHVRSGREGGFDHRHEVVAPICHHEEELGPRVDVIPGMEERFAQVPPELRPAGVPRREDREATCLHPRGGARGLRGLSRALDPLERQETATGHDAGFSHAGWPPAPERGWHAVRILRRLMSVLTPDPSSPEGAVGVPGRSPRGLLVFVGVLGCLLAVLSVVDMFMPKAYDGVVPDAYSIGGIFVRDIVPGGAAEKAGLRTGDTVLGIGHHMLNKAAEGLRSCAATARARPWNTS